MAVSDGEQGTPTLEQLRDCLLDSSQPIAKRTHSAFFLRTLGTAEAVSAVGEGDKTTKHLCCTYLFREVACCQEVYSY